MGELGPDPGSYGEAHQGLQENPQVQMAAHKVPQATGGGDGKDNHHTGTDGLEQWHAENHHESDLDIRRCADTKSTGQKSRHDTRRNAIEVKFPAGKDGLPDMEMVVQPVRLIQLDIEDESTGKDHDSCHEAKVIGGHAVRYCRSQEGAHDAADADNGPYPDHHFMFPEVAHGSGHHGKCHGCQGHCEGCMDGHTKAYGEKGNGYPGTTGPYKADGSA